MKNTVHLSNFHTHSTFCDGKNTPEEIVLTAIQKGFSAIGFSGHGYTPFDLRYCTKDMEGYIREVERLKEEYEGQIEIYLGAEEDAFRPVDRSRFSYLIGSSHYYLVDFPLTQGWIISKFAWMPLPTTPERWQTPITVSFATIFWSENPISSGILT